MWSPRKGREAAVRRTVVEQEAVQKKVDKVKKKQDQENTKIQK